MGDLGRNSSLKQLISEEALSLLDAGIINIGVHYAKDGFEIFARCSLPHPRLAITSYQSYDVEELVQLLRKAAKTVPHRQKGATAREESGESSKALAHTKVHDLAAAREHARNRSLDTVNLMGVSNSMPKASLNALDFNRDDDDLQARAFLVADAIGEPKLVAKIATDSSLKVRGAGGLYPWWAGASSLQKWKLLTNAKKAQSSHRKVTETDLHRLNLLSAPFQEPEEGVFRCSSSSSGEEEGGPN